MSQSQGKPSIVEHLLNRRMAICIYTGLMSGLPYYIFAVLVTAWLAKEEVSLRDIGMMSLIMLPYTWKFLWAPLLDRYFWSRLGRRKSWMLLSQLVIAICTLLLPYFSPLDSLQPIIILSILLIVFSATQDIVIDAYRREILPEAEFGIGNQVHVQAWRLAYLIPGSLGLILADQMPWTSVFAIVALFMVLGAVVTFIVPEPKIYNQDIPNIVSAFILPFKDFLKRHGRQQTVFILLFLFLYKLGDNMATQLATPMYLDLGYSLTEIGLVAKNAGFWASLVGGLIGGIWIIRLGINRALWVFGFVQLISIPGYYVLVSNPKSLWLLGAAVGFEYLGVGLGTAALVAYLMKTTSIAFAATQVAVLTSITKIPGVLANASTGYLVQGLDQDASAFSRFLFDLLHIPFDGLGWQNFFILCFVLALPGMFMLLKIAPWQRSDDKGNGEKDGEALSS